MVLAASAPPFSLSSAPTVRAIAFIDGQNLYRAAKDAFGYHVPNYGFPQLALKVCRLQSWVPKEIRFYTGIPEHAEDPHWHQFWSNKLRRMGWQGVKVFSRPLRYRDELVTLLGAQTTVRIAREKGIDVRIAIDVIRLALNREYDVALIFSQDQDFMEVADEVHEIANEQGRKIRVACAFPVSAAAPNNRGINNTEWIKLDKALYDLCLDTHDYTPRRFTKPTP